MGQPPSWGHGANTCASTVADWAASAAALSLPRICNAALES